MHRTDRDPGRSTRQARRLLVAVCAALAVGMALTGCSSDGVTAASETTDTTGVADAGDFCATFSAHAAQHEGAEDSTIQRDEAAWDRNIATVESIAATAPPEISAQADAYVEMVKDRKQLAADNGWADVADLPAEVREAFIRDHASLQQQVNQLLQYARDHCEGVS